MGVFGGFFGEFFCGQDGLLFGARKILRPASKTLLEWELFIIIFVFKT